VRFVFGYDAKANLVAKANGTPDDLYHELVGRAERAVATKPRTRPANVKDGIVAQRAYKVLRTTAEDVVEFDYRPGKCKKDYRVVALRKNISVERGDNVLFEEYRYFFYITNDRALSADEVVGEARRRCNQENLIAQLKGGVRGPARAGQHPQCQPGLHDHGRAGVEHQGLVRAAAARVAPVVRPPQC
jgi:hypothetical protein